MEKITVMLVDDHQMVRLGLSSYLNMQDDLSVVAEAVNGLDGVQTAKQPVHYTHLTLPTICSG